MLWKLICNAIWGVARESWSAFGLFQNSLMNLRKSFSSYCLKQARREPRLMNLHLVDLVVRPLEYLEDSGSVAPEEKKQGCIRVLSTNMIYSLNQATQALILWQQVWKSDWWNTVLFEHVTLTHKPCTSFTSGIVIWAFRFSRDSTSSHIPVEVRPCSSMQGVPPKVEHTRLNIAFPFRGITITFLTFSFEWTFGWTLWWGHGYHTFFWFRLEKNTRSWWGCLWLCPFWT